MWYLLCLCVCLSLTTPLFMSIVRYIHVCSLTASLSQYCSHPELVSSMTKVVSSMTRLLRRLTVG